MVARCIPYCYRSGMSRQIAVRLPDELVDFVDQLVEHGEASGRAAVVAHALDRERRRRAAERDADILARSGIDPELDQLAAFAAQLPLDDLE